MSSIQTDVHNEALRSTALEHLASEDPEAEALLRALNDSEYRSNLCSKPRSVIGKDQIEVSQFKRLVELNVANPKFRASFSTDPRAAMAERGIHLDPEQVRPAWDHDLGERFHKDAELVTRYPVIQRFLAFQVYKVRERTRAIEAGTPVHTGWNAWRQRQMKRVNIRHAPLEAQNLVHAPISFELSRGCSVGCPFCGVAAPPLKDHFTYTPENAEMWRGVLEALNRFAGGAAAAGFCYWATEPMDNPDYERFCSDFADITGAFPQTTTALPARSIDRVRNLLRLSSARGCLINRFSILSTGILDRVYRAFTPEELTFVEIIPQNKGALISKAAAGRARKPSSGKHEKSSEEVGSNASPHAKAALPSALTADQEYGFGTTIACVSGFLVNMASRTMRLIAPCQANDRWPLGYMVFDERRFEDAADFEFQLSQVFDDRACVSLDPGQLVQLGGGLKHTGIENGFKISSESAAVEFVNQHYGPLMQAVGTTLVDGTSTLAEASKTIAGRFGVQEAAVGEVLDLVFSTGVLAEAPETSQPLSIVQVESRAEGAGPRKDTKETAAPSIKERGYR